ncbi:MAG TPA: tRNA (adenosine(37)-N6)-threonylcarbamoyltransferase complex ATPase subunit type 1 TsaE, partial [Longimicrobiales bacterium]|nr:tRNA (adenosine(37)-N6)-threonylcarbamoyltransferase complex ATPase subunit type 1 TsaE [Longimicrobiales bacterium]
FPYLPAMSAMPATTPRMPPRREWTMTEQALEAWGKGLGEAAGAGGLALPLVIGLRGPLGAGKSVLARAVARGAGVAGRMPSPTYNLLFSYEGRGGVAIHHLDLYRLEDPEDVWELGWRELGEGDQIVLVEWPERAESLMPGDRWDVTLSFVEGEESLRRVAVQRRGGAPAVPPPDQEARS